MPSRAKIDAFLRAFFSPPNHFSLADVETGRASHVRPWIERLRAVEPKATVLPLWREGVVVWYTIAFTSEQAGALADALLAFAGPSYSTFRGLGEPLDMSSPIDARVAEITSGIGRRFRDGGTREWRAALWVQLETMRQVLDRRPVTQTDRPRPLSRILRDFYMALAVGSQSGVDTYLRQLTDRRDVDVSNALFLRVQALAAFGRWQELLALPELGDLLDMRRPLAVTEALLRAVYHSELASHYRNGGALALVDRFASEIRPRFRALVSQRSGLRAPEAAVMLMLEATVGDKKDLALRDALLALPDIPDHYRTVLTLLADGARDVALPAEGDNLTLARRAYEARDFDSVLTFASGSNASLESSRLLLEAAFQLQSLEAQEAALRQICALSEEERESLLSLRIQRVMYESLVRTAPTAVDAVGGGEPLLDDVSKNEDDEGLTSGTPGVIQETVPRNWIEWLDRLNQGRHWPRALEIARQGASEWSVEALLERPNVVSELATTLDRASSSPTLHLALPHLFAFWERDLEGPRRELAPIYRSMLYVLALGSQGAEEDFALAFDLIRVLLRFGPGEDEYRLIVEQIDLMLDRFASDDRLDWALDVLDLLIANHCPDAALQVGALIGVVTLFKRRHRRVDGTQWDLLRHLAEDMGQPQALEGVAPDLGVASSPSGTSDTDYLLRALRNKVVAIYSLTETASRRVRDMIMSKVPETTVELSAEKVGTDSLRSLARNADVFIVVTASSKHAATEFIEANRPKSDPSRVTLRPKGRGAASILRALFEYLARIREATTRSEAA